MPRLFLILLLYCLFVVGCSRPDVPATTPAGRGTPTNEPATATPAATTVASPVPATATATAVLPSPTPAVTPTTTPLSLAVDAAVPAGLRTAVGQMVAEREDLFTLSSDEAEVRLAVNGGTPLAEWVLAVAAPFATLADGLTLAEVQAAWDEGRLYLDGETAALLTAVWGEPTQVVQPVAAEALVAAVWAAQGSYDDLVLAVVPFEKLVPQLKVLRVDGVSPVDMDFDPAGYALTFSLGLEGDAEDVAAVQAAWNGLVTNRDDGRITHVTMTGPAGMRRAVADRMERYGINYPGEETGPVLQAADIAHMSNENAFASDCPMPDPYDSVNVCNRDEYLALMIWMGIDVNEMTGNHLNDWGPDALQHTFDLYEEAGIGTFGGGRNLEHARQPLLMEHNGNRIAFVGCNPVGPESGWAREDYPGALPCDDYSFLTSEIARLRDEGYLVIATLQYLEDYQYNALVEQRTVFHALADAGATAVSGSHAHHPQGFAFRGDSFVHYGLGNLLADQMWSLGSRQMFMDSYLFYDGRLLNVDLWTGMNEDYARVRQMTAGEREELLRAVFEVSDWGNLRP